MAVAGALFNYTLTILSCRMFLFLMILGLVLLIAGSVGLVVTNTGAEVGSLNWTQGNITFATFTVVGIGMLIFLGIFGSEIE